MAAAAAKESPGPAGAGPGPSSYEKLPLHFTADTDPVPTLREAQALVAGLLVKVDRLDAAGCRLLALIGGAQ